MKIILVTVLAVLAVSISSPAFADVAVFSDGGIEVTGDTFVIVGKTCYYRGTITLTEVDLPLKAFKANTLLSGESCAAPPGTFQAHTAESFATTIVFSVQYDTFMAGPHLPGTASISLSYSFVHDNTPPTLAVSTQNTANRSSTGWYNANSLKVGTVGVAVTVGPIADAGSGIASRSITIADSDNATWYSAPASLMDAGGPVSYSFSRDGIYTLKAQGSDKVGNNSSITYTYRVDLSPPKYRSGQFKSTVLGDGISQYSQLRLAWPQADEPTDSGTQSGMAGYYLEVNGTVVAGSGPSGPLLSPLVVSFDLPISGYDRAVPHPLAVTVHALDVAGNETSLSTLYQLPPTVSVGATSKAALVSEEGPLSQTSVTLTLQITPKDFLQYSLVTFRRSGASLAATSGLDGSTFSVAPSSVVGSGSQVIGVGWSLGSDGNLQYRENLPALFGIGGRLLSYTVTSETLAAAETSEPGGLPRTLRLPAHPGTMAVEILDLKGKAVAVNTDVLGDTQSLFVDPTGFVRVRITGTGIDGDDWTVGVHELIPQKTGTITVIQDVQLGGSENTNRLYPYDAATFNTATSQYPTVLVPVTLSLGHNNIQVQWVQGLDPDLISRTSRFLDLDYEATLGDHYTLTVTTRDSPAVKQDGSAIVLAPGQPVSFHLRSDVNTADLSAVTWDFDGETSRGADVSHVYHQVANQGSDSVNHTVMVRNLEDSPDTALAVIVRDTQDGALYESETWNGPHTITGNVLVPPACTLSIGTSGAETDVTFAGGFSSNLHQGLAVQGALLAGLSGGFESAASGSKVVFAPEEGNPSATGLSWGTILIKGSAAMTGVTVSGGDRGVTLAGVRARLDNVVLTGNTIGLHVLSGDIAVTGCSIAGNTAYGVKEDGGRPVMTDSRVAENGLDYYESGVGGLTLAEVDSLGSNSGNTGGLP